MYAYVCTLVSRISVQARISVQGGILKKKINKHRGGNFDKKLISVQGGVLIKILEHRVKTGNFIDNRPQPSPSI